MRVLILGASGYLGRALYDKCKSIREFEVVGTARRENATNEFVLFDVLKEQSVIATVHAVMPEIGNPDWLLRAFGQSRVRVGLCRCYRLRQNRRVA